VNDHPHTREAMERWRQGKINVFDALAELEDQRDKWRECAELFANNLCRPKGDNPTAKAFAEFDRLKGQIP
jgi:hypothetical protein